MKKSSSGLNILFRYASGGLILFVIFLLFRKKKAISTQKQAYNLSSKPINSFNYVYELIRREEGINYTAKRDGTDKNGKPLFTIGIGHQIQPEEEYLLTGKISETDAINLYQKDIKNIVDDMNKNIKVELNKNQQLALISLRYRIGPGNFNNSTLLKELNKGNYQKAAEEFKNWKISDGRIVPGLVARAEREKALFLTPIK